MEILYKYFKTWFDHYKSKNSNEMSVSFAITAITLELGLLVMSLSMFYRHLIMGEVHVFKDKMENKPAIFLLLLGYFLISRVIFKKVITKYFLFDIEKGESSKYSYESTKKDRNLNVYD